MSGKVEIFGMTDVGREREHNEDNFAICQDLQLQEWRFQKGQEVKLGQLGALLVVADGMGGTNAGEVASDIAQKTIREIFSGLNHTLPQSIHTFLKDAILKAHQAIVNHAQANPECSGMGTTLIISWVIGNQLHVAWSGDSRCYVHSKGQLQQIGRDHSMVADLVEAGQISEEAAWDHPDSNIITQSLGDAYNRPKPDALTHPLATGDRIVVCSDGLNGMLRDREIAETLNEAMPTAETCRKLVEQSNLAGGHDNITVLILDAKHLPPANTQPEAASDMTKSQMIRKVSRKNLIIAVLAVLLLGFIGFEAYTRLSENNNEGEEKEEVGGQPPQTEVGNSENNAADSSSQSGAAPEDANADARPQSPPKSGSPSNAGSSSDQGDKQGKPEPSPEEPDNKPNFTDQDTVNTPPADKDGGLTPIDEQGSKLLPGQQKPGLNPLLPNDQEFKAQLKEVIEIKAEARQKLGCIVAHAKKDEVDEAQKQIERSDQILKEMYNLVTFENNAVTKLPSTKADRNTLNNKIPEWKKAYQAMNIMADQIIGKVEKSNNRRYEKVQSCLKP